jgi:hypothetical protein
VRATPGPKKQAPASERVVRHDGSLYAGHASLVLGVFAIFLQGMPPVEFETNHLIGCSGSAHLLQWLDRLAHV